MCLVVRGAIKKKQKKIHLEGQVSRDWNGESTTLFTAEAPFQPEVEPARVTVNATFVYCTQVSVVICCCCCCESRGDALLQSYCMWWRVSRQHILLCRSMYYS